MSEINTPASKKKRPAVYKIHIRGRLDEDWVEWFDDMTLTHTGEGDTVLSGPVPDQAALHGILNKIRNLNLDLISVTQVESNASLQERDHRQEH